MFYLYLDCMMTPFPNIELRSIPLLQSKTYMPIRTALWAKCGNLIHYKSQKK